MPRIVRLETLTIRPHFFSRICGNSACAALKAMYAQQTKPEFQKYFQDGFMSLSQFQDGVGPVPIDGKMLNSDLKANLDANVVILETYALWQNRALAELDSLEDEWARFKGA
jgi:hypothetical protein